MGILSDVICKQIQNQEIKAMLPKNFQGSLDICPMGFINSIQICVISNQTILGLAIWNVQHVRGFSWTQQKKKKKKKKMTNLEVSSLSVDDLWPIWC